MLLTCAKERKSDGTRLGDFSEFAFSGNQLGTVWTVLTTWWHLLSEH